jgi:surface polysaccharide O-acyltransferase-like enzyme
VVEKTGTKTFVPWVDLIRVIAIWMVIIVHVSGQLINAWGEIPNTQWFIADIYAGSARFGVLTFFMLSGYLLLPRSESLGAFHMRWLVKVLIPLVVWSLIYLGWYCGNHAGICTPDFTRNLIFVEGTYYHLWFLYAIISIYLILPVLRLIIPIDSDKKMLWYVILLWLIFEPLLTLANKLWGFDINIRAPLATSFVGYFILGYLLGELALSRSKIILTTVIWVTGTLITIVGTYLLTRAAGQFDGYLYELMGFNAILISGAMFILVRWAAETKLFASPHIYTLTRGLATTTFGVYLVHILVMEVLSDRLPFIHLNCFMGNAIWSIPLISILVFFLSLLIVRILQRVPILNKIVP